MLIEKDLILQAKEKLGDEAAIIIAKDLQLKEFDEDNLRALCCNHKEDTPSFIWDRKSLRFHCFGCSYNLDIVDHYMNFYNLTFLEAVEKLFNQVDIKYSFNEKGIKSRDYKYPEYVLDENKSIVEKYFEKRKISTNTLDYFNITQSDGLVTWNFYDENDLLVTVKQRHAHKPIGKEPKEWFIPNYDYKHILYGMNKIDTTKPLVITEGQIDCLSVFESGYTNVVSIPSGTENMKWVTECFEWLEQFDKIILWFDNDVPGIKARKNASSQLGAWRTLFIDLPQELEREDYSKIKVKDANEVLFYFGADKVISLIDNAQEIPVQGVVDLSTVGDFDVEKIDGLYTHLKPLEDIVYKLLMGTVVIVTGTRGSGKSSLINQIFVSEALNQNFDIFLYSGELSPQVLKHWIDINLAGEEKIKMKNDFIRKIDPQAKQDMENWYKNRVWIYDNISNKSEDVLDRAITVTRKYGVKIWILDNLMTLNLGDEDDNYSTLKKQKEFMVNLIQYAQLYNVLIVLAIHPHKLSALQPNITADDIGGSGNLTNMAHTLLSVHRYSKKDKEGETDGKGNYKKGKEPINADVGIEILKNRYFGKMGVANLSFNFPDYRFFSKDEELVKRYGWNQDQSPLPKPKKRNDQPDFMNE